MNKIFYIGIVENRNDPLQLGRLQVRVFGVHSESLDDVPTDSLPWAIPILSSTSASISGIGNSVTGFVEGSMVLVVFIDGESKQQPLILGSAASSPITKSIYGEQGVLEREKDNKDLFGDGTTTGADTGTTGTNDETVEVVPENPTPETAANGGIDMTKAIAQYGENVTKVYNELLRYGITNNNAIVAILSNVGKECAFKPRRENLNYTTRDLIRKTFVTKTKLIPNEKLDKYVSQPEKLGNLVYADRNGNGDESSGDGYKFRGGGYIQLTGRDNFKKIGDAVGLDLIANPELVNDPVGGGKIVAQYMITAFGGKSRVAFSNLDIALMEVTRKVNYGGYATDIVKVKEIAKLFTITTDNSPTEKDTVSPNAPENDLKEDVTAADDPTSPKLGYKDNNAKYPLKSLIKEQDTNRLARGSTTDTFVDVKQRNRRTNIKNGTQTFDEPLPAYNAVYPHNHVFFTEAGHALEFDNTPKSERVHLYHKAGTFIEIDAEGNQTNKIIGSSFSITEKNGYVYIDGTARVTVGSNVRLHVGGNMDVIVDGNLNYDVGGNITMKVGASIAAKTGSGISLRSDSSVDIDGSRIMLNSNTAKQATVDVRSGTQTDYTAPHVSSSIGDSSLAVEEMSETSIKSYMATEIKNGTVTQKQIDDGDLAKAKPLATDDKAAAAVEAVSTTCDLKDKTNIPDSTKLSKYYTLGMLSSATGASKYKVVSQRGLSVGEIACNLKAVALNCLDKIKEKYPRMLVTSGFRVGTGGSQHLIGQAIDMQFGVTNSEYYEIAQWIRDNVLFDQLLLEYKTIESGKAWIHVSYAANPRKAVYTYMNHSNAGSGLRKLQ